MWQLLRPLILLFQALLFLTHPGLYVFRPTEIQVAPLWMVAEPQNWYRHPGVPQSTPLTHSYTQMNVADPPTRLSCSLTSLARSGNVRVKLKGKDGLEGRGQTASGAWDDPFKIPLVSPAKQGF